MLDDLIARAALPPAARLLDLGCGPGRVSLPIARHFAEVVGVDPEPELVEAGKGEAVRLRIAAMRWVVSTAEAFEAPAASFDLVTAGESFHRFDQPRVAALTFGWLRPGGALANMGFADLMSGETPWRRVLAGVAREFVDQPAQRRDGTTVADPIAEQEDLLRDAGFDPVTSYDFEAQHEWTLAELLGFLRSTSVASRGALGDRHVAFEAALTAALLAHDPSGRYLETVRCGYTLARRP